MIPKDKLDKAIEKLSNPGGEPKNEAQEKPKEPQQPKQEEKKS
jgi:hypothetical protein